MSSLIETWELTTQALLSQVNETDTTIRLSSYCLICCPVFLISTFVSPISQGLYGSGNPGNYLNFSLAFSGTGKSLKMLGGPGKSWNL